MYTENFPSVEFNDKFDDYNFKLTFIESALRSMIQTGNITESYVGDGLAVIMLSLIEEYKDLKNSIDLRSQSTCCSTYSQDPNGKATIDEKGKKT